MALQLGSITVLDPKDSSKELPDMSWLYVFPPAAIAEVEKWFYAALVIMRWTVKVQAPSREVVDDFFRRVSTEEACSLIMNAEVNGLMGGLVMTVSKDDSGRYQYRVSSHT